MKISFDFDETLSKSNVQIVCLDLINKGFDIWITTSRLEQCFGPYAKIPHNEDLFKIADILTISKEKIHFTNMEYKADYLSNNNFDIHIDDDYHELKALRYTEVIGIDVTRKSWIMVLEEEIQRRTYGTKL